VVTLLTRETLDDAFGVEPLTVESSVHQPGALQRRQGLSSVRPSRGSRSRCVIPLVSSRHRGQT
jgi:hypothetical protein